MAASTSPEGTGHPPFVNVEESVDRHRVAVGAPGGIGRSRENGRSRNPRYHGAMADARIVIEPDPVIEAFKKDIDRSLLRVNLKLSPEERLRKMHAALRGALALREAYKQSRP
jgi:hypothetical protein